MSALAKPRSCAPRRAGGGTAGEFVCAAFPASMPVSDVFNRGGISRCQLGIPIRMRDDRSHATDGTHASPWGNVERKLTLGISDLQRFAVQRVEDVRQIRMAGAGGKDGEQTRRCSGVLLRDGASLPASEGPLPLVLLRHTQPGPRQRLWVTHIGRCENVSGFALLDALAQQS